MFTKEVVEGLAYSDQATMYGKVLAGPEAILTKLRLRKRPTTVADSSSEFKVV
jgi:hypothetical protein